MMTVVHTDDNWVVLGARNVPEARELLIEYLLENDELDNFGVCTEADKEGICNLKEGITCPACTDFLKTIFNPYRSVQETATYWKEL